MTNRVIVNTLDFTRKGKHQKFVLTRADLPRLTDEAVIVNGEIEANVYGDREKDGKPFLDLDISGGMKLTCQRCLDLYDFQINYQSRFIIAKNESQLGEVGEEEEAINTILAEPELDLLNFIEEELLLALPMMPLHDEGVCVKPQVFAETLDETNPFIGLK